MRVIIAGGRDFNDYDLLKNNLDLFLKDVDEEIIIVEGEANGADLLGKKYGKERGYKIEEYSADWDLYGKSAGYKRNEQMAKVSQILFAFWDKKSKGTKHMIDLANNLGLEVIVVHYTIKIDPNKRKKIIGILNTVSEF